MNKLMNIALLCLGFASAAVMAAESGVQQRPRPPQADPQQHAEQWKARWDQVDANHDGMLSREEMEQGMPRLAKHFDQLDRNGDGEVTPEELRAAFQARKEQRQRQTN